MKRATSIAPYKSTSASLSQSVCANRLFIVFTHFNANDRFRNQAETASWETLAYGEGKSKPRVGGVGRPAPNGGISSQLVLEVTLTTADSAIRFRRVFPPLGDPPQRGGRETNSGCVQVSEGVTSCA